MKAGCISCWSLSFHLRSRDHGSLKTRLTQLWKAISSHRSAWPFHEPVDTKVVIDYLDHIKVPIDLSEIAKRIDRGAYLSKAAFKADLELMCKNCTTYNTPDTTYHKYAGNHGVKFSCWWFDALEPPLTFKNSSIVGYKFEGAMSRKRNHSFGFVLSNANSQCIPGASLILFILQNTLIRPL